MPSASRHGSNGSGGLHSPRRSIESARAAVIADSGAGWALIDVERTPFGVKMPG